MASEPKVWDYSCSGDCANRVEAAPVPNTVRCGICGKVMDVYTTEEGQ